MTNTLKATLSQDGAAPDVDVDFTQPNREYVRIMQDMDVVLVARDKVGQLIEALRVFEAQP